MSTRNRVTQATADLIYSQTQRTRAASPPGAVRGAGDVDLSVTPAGTLEFSDTSIKCCIDFARIVMGVKHAPLLQRWLPLNELNRTTGKQGYTRTEFNAELGRYGIKGGRGYNTRLLRKGNGVYWNLHGDMIYPIGFVELSERVLNRAAMLGKHDLYLNGNHPGSRKPMYINIGGSASDFESAILATWYHEHGETPISRYTITALFNRDRRAIWRLETIAGIEIIYNEAETTDPADVPLNADGELRGGIYKTTDRFKRTVYHIRMANSYVTGAIRQHHRKGQGRKASISFKQWLNSDRLHGNREAKGMLSTCPVKLNRVSRTYCENEMGVKSSRKRGNLNPLYTRYKPGRGAGVVWRINITHVI